jgi:hypothetical protein
MIPLPPPELHGATACAAHPSHLPELMSTCTDLARPERCDLPLPLVFCNPASPRPVAPLPAQTCMNRWKCCAMRLCHYKGNATVAARRAVFMQVPVHACSHASSIACVRLSCALRTWERWRRNGNRMPIHIHAICTASPVVIQFPQAHAIIWCCKHVRIGLCCDMHQEMRIDHNTS